MARAFIARKRAISLPVVMIGLFLGLFACQEPVAEKNEPQTEPQAKTETNDQFFETGRDYAASQVLIAYEGANKAPPNVVRTREEALEKANQLLERLLEEPGLFEELARMESDGPAALVGGFLGYWDKGGLVAGIDEGLEKAAIGEIAPEPVETPFGIHILRREPTRAKFYSGEALFIAFKGSPQTPATVSRTREEAEQLALELAPKIKGANFTESALKYNDLYDGPAPFPPFKEKDTMIPPNIKDLVKQLAFDEVGGPIETPVGFAFIKRTRVVQNAGSHILIAYSGAKNADPAKVTRTKEEAQAKALELIERLQKEPASFIALAQEHSDGPSGPNGGDLGVWFKGAMVPAFDQALSLLKEGEITATPVETEFGYHIIKRNPVPQ